MNLLERINEVRKAVDYIRKDKSVSGMGGGYMAVTHDNVTAMTRGALIEHGVMLIPSLKSERCVDTGSVTKGGTPIIRLECVYTFHVVNVEDSHDRFEMDVLAHANDQGDKAPGKVLSYAKKYALLKLLDIESGDDEEGRVEQHKKSAKSVSQDVWDKLTNEQRQKLTDSAMSVVGLLSEGEERAAYEEYRACVKDLDTDEQVAYWSRFSSKERTAIKRMSDAFKKQKESTDAA